MNLQDFCWSWFKQSGHPAAYMEYLQLNQKVSGQDHFSSAGENSGGLMPKKHNGNDYF